MPSLPAVARFALPGLAFCLVLSAGAASGAEREEAPPKPDSYLCPNAPQLGVDCFLEAVEHLYTMCRQVKSIEIIEFGYEKSDEGTNGAKSEYCVDKHKATINRPLNAALREAGKSKPALAALKELHAAWLRALADLKWKPPETDDEYKGRVARPYDDFHERAAIVRTALTAPPATKPAAAPARKTASAPTH
jgi:hypothetical protein